MDQIPLHKFCEDNTQTVAAQILGCSQGAVSQMLKAGREIFIVPRESGGFDWYELRRNRRVAQTS